jgi:hypothetical protein
VSNRFEQAKNVNELMYRLVGAASTCWVDGVLDTARAIKVADDGINRLVELGWHSTAAERGAM